MKENKRFIINYLTLICGVTAVMALLMLFVRRIVLPSQLLMVPVFFVALLGAMLLVRRSVVKKGKPMQFFFMVYRPVKLVLVLIFLLAYMFVVRECLIQFVAVFAVFYLALLVYETRYFVKYEAKSV